MGSMLVVTIRCARLKLASISINVLVSIFVHKSLYCQLTMFTLEGERYGLFELLQLFC